MEIEKEVVHKIYEEGKSQNYIKGVIEKHHSPYHCEFTISHTYSIYRTTLFNILDCLYPKPVIEDIYYENWEMAWEHLMVKAIKALPDEEYGSCDGIEFDPERNLIFLMSNAESYNLYPVAVFQLDEPSPFKGLVYHGVVTSTIKINFNIPHQIPKRPFEGYK